MTQPDRAITPCLWFDGNAEEAFQFWQSVFQDAEVLGLQRMPGGTPDAPAPVLTMRFRIRDQVFIALNGGPRFRFNEAISLTVSCCDQAELNRIWSALLEEGGEALSCGWLKDRFGMSWQIVPAELPELMAHPDPAVAARVFQALMTMTRIEIDGLRAARDAAT